MNIDGLSSQTTVFSKKPLAPAAKSPPRPTETAIMHTDSIELSAGAKKVTTDASTRAQSQSVANMLASARSLVDSNPARARSSLEALISQYPNSPEAQKAQIQLAQISAPD